MNLQNFYTEYIEEKHYCIRDGKVLFEGTPDVVRRYGRRAITIVLDYKFGRADVPEADVNTQLRAYLVMVPAEEIGDSYLYTGYSAEFRPSSLLRFKLCPGSLALERKMRADGLTPPETEDALEGRRLHEAVSDAKRPRDDLSPEQMETVQQAERMSEEFVAFVLGQSEPLPYYGAIVQPRTKSKADTVYYRHDDIVQAKAEIYETFDNAQKPDAPRNASADACKFCPCKAICPEYNAWIMAIDKIRHLPSAQWTGEQWDIFLSRRREFLKFLEDRYSEAREILSAIPDAIPGWTLKPGNKVRSVTDIPAAFNALKGIVDAKEFTAACSMSFGELEEIYWRKRKASDRPVSQKEAKNIINMALTGLIEVKQNQPSVKKTSDDTD